MNQRARRKGPEGRVSKATGLGLLVACAELLLASNVAAEDPPQLRTILEEAKKSRLSPPVAFEVQAKSEQEFGGTPQSRSWIRSAHLRWEGERVEGFADPETNASLNAVSLEELDKQAWADYRATWNGRFGLWRALRHLIAGGFLFEKPNYKYLILHSESFGTFLDGRFFATLPMDWIEIVESVAGDALGPTPAEIDGHACWFIFAETPYGQFKLWVDPEYGCLLRRAEVVILPGHQFGGEPVGEDSMFRRVEFEITDVELADVEGRFVSVAGRRTHIRYPTAEDAGPSISTHHARRSNFDFSPDFDALGAFKVDLAQGGVVQHAELPGLKLIWNGTEFEKQEAGASGAPQK